MTVSITVDNLDAQLVESLRAEARRRGVDVSAVVRELLNEGIRPLANTTAAPPYRDLHALAGTWSDKEADSFLWAIADLGCVDEDMWK